MTFPIVASEASSSQSTNTTTHTVTMPSGVASGDLLVAAIEFDGRPVRSGQIIDNWTEILNTSDSGDGVSLYAYWKRATGSEGSSQTISTDVAQCSSHKTWRITGDNTGTVPASAVFQGSSPGTSADPPSLNPGSWDVEDTLWLALVASDDGSITVTGFPGSYTNTGQVNADGSTDGVTLGWARRENATASENPGAFTLSSATPFCTATIAIRPALPVSHLATGTKSAGGTTTVSPSYPAGVADDVLAIACRAAWQNLVTTASETGWTDHTDLLGGLVGTNSADSHQTRVAVDLRQLDGSESGSVSFDQGGTISGALGLIMLYAKSPSSATWSTAIVTGDDATHGANRSVTASGSVSLAPGDVVVAVAAVDTDTSLASFSAPAITASGITFGTTTRRTSGAGVGTGNDGNLEVFDATVTSGTGTVAPVLAFTTTTSQCGPVAFIRLRSVTGDVTGTAAVTQDAQTSSASGQLGYSGTSTPTQAAQTSTASGTASDPVTGTVAVTQADEISTAAGQLGYSGTAVVTQADQTPAAAGQLGYSGTVAVPQEAHAAAGSGTVVAFSGAVAVTQGDQVPSASGQLGYTGTSAASQAAQISVATGQLGYSGTAAPVQHAQTSTATGILGVAGSVSAAQADQTAAGSGQLGYAATAAITQAAQTSTASGTVTGTGVTGSAAATQADQTPTASGHLGYSGLVAATAANQTSSATGQLGYMGTVAAVQAGQVAAASGTFAAQITGTLAAVQASQTAAAAGTVLAPGFVPPVAAVFTETFPTRFAETVPAISTEPAHPVFREPAAVTFREQR